MTTSDVPLFAGSPIPYSTEPYNLKKSDAQKIEQAFTSVLKNVEDFTNQALKDRALLKALGVPEDLDPTPTPLGLHIPFARFDFLFDGKDIFGLELNTDGTSGYNVTEWCGEKAGLKAEENPNLNLSARLLESLRAHDPSATEIVLVDFPGISTSWEQTDLIKRWKKTFSGAHFAEPSIQGWKSGALCYRRILSWQLRSQRDQCKAFLKDWEQNKIKVIGGWSSDVGMSKAWPHFLKPDVFPETRILDETMARQLKEERESWVIKGALSYSGKAIFRGSDLTQKRWDLCLQNALEESKNGRAWVAQKRIQVPLLDGKPVELGIYFLNGKASGYMCRWGSDDAISETSSDVLRPVRIIAG